MNKRKVAGRIHFSFADVRSTFGKRKDMKRVILEIFDRNQQPMELIQYVFCSDEYLIDLNIRFLKHHTYTDILTFTLSEPALPRVGEIYISLDRVRENAISRGIRFELEIARVVFHGALHLCGYKDKTSAQKMNMRHQETFYLSRLR